MPRLDLPGLPPRRTVAEVAGSVKDNFLSIIGHSYSEAPQYKMPEDSWVPFHLEVGRKLIEGEWWSEERRDEFADLVQKLREADPGGTTENNETFDPFNFYQAFCQRQDGRDRMECFEILQDVFGMDTSLPDATTKIWNIDAGRRIKEAVDGDRLEAFWDMLRAAVKMDPARDPKCRDEFASHYDRVHAAGDRSEWWRVLSTWLYLIDPTKYVHLYRLEKLGILNELGLGYFAGGGAGAWAGGYVRALARARELADQAGLTLLDLNRESTTRAMLGLEPIGGGGAVEPYGIDGMLDDGVFLEEEEISRMLRILQTKKNLILQGPPGVGKTFIAKRLAYALMGSESDERITSVQFHQSYSYEDFVGGFRPRIADGRMAFKPKDGPFLEVCKKARGNDDEKYIVLIDEINRGNLSRVFGELLMLIEADKRDPKHGATLQHRPEFYSAFFVPENVYIIGTMNLADRSLTGMNVAMRRRFGFVDLKPQFNERVFTDWLSA